MGFLSRSQIQKLHRLGGVRNANRILKDMEEFLNVVRLHENVYYLNSEGRQRVGADRVLKKTHQIQHHLMRNSLFINYGCPASWKNEVKLTVKGELSIIADAVFHIGGVYHIIEIDRTQKMSENRNKINKYRRLLEIGEFAKTPKFIWVTTTEYRRKQLLHASEGLNVRVFLASDFK